MAFRASAALPMCSVEVDARLLRRGRDAVDAREFPLAGEVRAADRDAPWCPGGCCRDRRRSCATRSMRPRSIGKHDACFFAEDAQTSAPADVDVLHVEREQRRFDRKRRRCRARRASTRPQVRTSKVASTPSRRAPAIEISARLGFDGFLRTLRGRALERGQEPDLVLALHARVAPARVLDDEIVDDDARRLAVRPRCAPRRCSMCSTSVPSGR